MFGYFLTMTAGAIFSKITEMSFLSWIVSFGDANITVKVSLK